MNKREGKLWEDLKPGFSWAHRATEKFQSGVPDAQVAVKGSLPLSYMELKAPESERHELGLSTDQAAFLANAAEQDIPCFVVARLARRPKCLVLSVNLILWRYGVAEVRGKLLHAVTADPDIWLESMSAWQANVVCPHHNLVVPGMLRLWHVFNKGIF